MESFRCSVEEEQYTLLGNLGCSTAMSKQLKAFALFPCHGILCPRQRSNAAASCRRAVTKGVEFVCGDMDCEGTTFKHPRETLRQNGVVKYVEYSFERLRAILQKNKMWRAGVVDHGDSSCALPCETFKQNNILSFDVVDFENHSLGIPVTLHNRTKLISENLPLCLDERPCNSTTF